MRVRRFQKTGMESSGNASNTRGAAKRVSGGKVEAVSREVMREGKG